MNKKGIPTLNVRMAISTVLLGVSLLGLTGTVASAQDRSTSFAGKWVLDMKRTKDLPETLEGYRLQVAQSEQELRIETEVLGDVRGARAGMRGGGGGGICLLYTSPSPRDLSTSRMPSSA